MTGQEQLFTELPALQDCLGFTVGKFVLANPETARNQLQLTESTSDVLGKSLLLDRMAVRAAVYGTFTPSSQNRDEIDDWLTTMRSAQAPASVDKLSYPEVVSLLNPLSPAVEHAVVLGNIALAESILGGILMQAPDSDEELWPVSISSGDAILSADVVVEDYRDEDGEADFFANRMVYLYDDVAELLEERVSRLELSGLLPTQTGTVAENRVTMEVLQADGQPSMRVKAHESPHSDDFSKVRENEYIFPSTAHQRVGIRAARRVLVALRAQLPADPELLIVYAKEADQLLVDIHGYVHNPHDAS